MGGYGCFLRYGWRGVVASLALLFPLFAPAAEIYIGIAPAATTTPPVPSPGTLLKANDVTPPTATIIADSFPGSSDPTGYGGLAFDSSGNLWATVGIDDPNIGSANEYGTLASTLVRIDPVTGQVAQTVGAVTYGGSPLGIADLSIQPGTDAIYGVSSPFDSQCDSCLFSINAFTGQASLIGSAPKEGTTRVQLYTIGFAPDGTLYSGGYRSGDSFSYDTFFKVSPTTGQVVTNMGFICGDTQLFGNQPTCPGGASAGYAYVTQGMAVRGDGTVFATLLDDNHEIVFYDAANNIWHNLGDTGIPVNSSVLADLAFAPAAVPTPLPASIWLFGSGLAALVGLRRRRH